MAESNAHKTGKSFADQHGYDHSGGTGSMTIEPAPGEKGSVIDRQAGTRTDPPRYKQPVPYPGYAKDKTNPPETTI